MLPINCKTLNPEDFLMMENFTTLNDSFTSYS